MSFEDFLRNEIDFAKCVIGFEGTELTTTIYVAGQPLFKKEKELDAVEVCKRLNEAFERMVNKK